jgi:transposase
VANCVVDSSSIAVNRRHRRAKTDRLDVQQLLTMLLRHVAGERKVWRIVRVPSVEEEDRRQLHRAFTTANRDRTRVINRIMDEITLPTQQEWIRHARTYYDSLSPSTADS